MSPRVLLAWLACARASQLTIIAPAAGSQVAGNVMVHLHVEGVVNTDDLVCYAAQALDGIPSLADGAKGCVEAHSALLLRALKNETTDAYCVGVGSASLPAMYLTVGAFLLRAWLLPHGMATADAPADAEVGFAVDKLFYWAEALPWALPVSPGKRKSFFASFGRTGSTALTRFFAGHLGGAAPWISVRGLTRLAPPCVHLAPLCHAAPPLEAAARDRAVYLHGDPALQLISLFQTGHFAEPDYCGLAMRDTVDLVALRARKNWTLEEYLAAGVDALGMEAHFESWWRAPKCPTLFVRFEALGEPGVFETLQNWLDTEGEPMEIKPSGRASVKLRDELKRANGTLWYQLEAHTASFAKRLGALPDIALRAAATGAALATVAVPPTPAGIGGEASEY